MPALRTRETHPPARPLEVVTSAPPPPALAIIAPTPRTFTFPAVHNLGDSPYSSPSTSPFEDPPSSLASTPVSVRRTPPPLSAFTRTLWPDSSSFSVFTSPSPPVRASSSSPRRPKKGDEDYVKRPENAFILFRRKWSKDHRADSPLPTAADADAPKKEKKPRQADLSKSISQKWRALPPEERAYWEGLAREKKREHEMRHPGYVYRPQRRNRAPKPQEQQQVEIVLPVGRRSASAPAAQSPYQAIQIPNVYAPGEGGGYFSDDPASLMPIIARLGVGNGQGGFDYLPSAGTFETSEFLKSLIFPLPPTPILTTTPVSHPESAAGSLFSPASSDSASGSAPPSPHTPPSALMTGSAGFPPSVFTAPPAAASPHPQISSSPEIEEEARATYTPWASSASPWGRTLRPEPGFEEGDFDIGSIPEIEWGAGVAVGGTGTGTQGEVFGGAGAGAGVGAPLELDAQKGELPFGPFDVDVELGDHAMDFEQWMHQQTF